MPRVFCLAGLFAAIAPAAYAQTSKLIYSESPPVWFEAHKITAAISPDGATVLLLSRWPRSLRLIDVATGAVRESSSSALNQFRMAVGDTAWNAAGGVAYFRRAHADSGITVARGGTRAKRFEVPGTVSAVAWLDSVNLLALASDTRGASSLFRINSTTGQRSLIARALDADPLTSRIAVARDGRRAYIALAADTAAPPEARHDPFADRDLDIYEIDLRSGARRPIIDTDADESAPFVVGEDLYWTSSRMQSSIVLLPVAGGGVRHVVPNAMHPSWHPSGRTLGLFYGAFRSADWVLNWDGGTLDVDTATTSPGIKPLLTNFHEDFERALTSKSALRPTGGKWARPIGRAMVRSWSTRGGIRNNRAGPTRR
jgi:hypothetical protein